MEDGYIILKVGPALTFEFREVDLKLNAYDLLKDIIGEYYRRLYLCNKEK